MHVDAKCQNLAKNERLSSNVLVISGWPKAAKEYWFALWRKAAFLGLFWRACVYHVSGGRPKAAIDHAALRRVAEGRPCLQFVDLCARG